MTVKRIGERSEKGDLFSFAVILWELVTLEVPWRQEKYTSEDIKESVVDGARLVIPVNCPENVAEVMRMCWKHDPSQRPEFGMLVDCFESLLNKKD